ncbi:MAG: hypothetical protein ABSA96_05545 [Candidatus Acidiferrales bacterium]
MTVKSLLTMMTAAALIFAIPSRSQRQMQTRAPIQLPDGDAKPIVETACAACHSLSNIANAGHSPEEWRTTIAMMRNAGAALPDNKVEMVTNYLIKNFPEKPAPPAAHECSDVRSARTGDG